MPEYGYNGNGNYTFDGNNVNTPFNPNIGVSGSRPISLSIT